MDAASVTKSFLSLGLLLSALSPIKTYGDDTTQAEAKSSATSQPLSNVILQPPVCDCQATACPCDSNIHTTVEQTTNLDVGLYQRRYDTTLIADHDVNSHLGVLGNVVPDNKSNPSEQKSKTIGGLLSDWLTKGPKLSAQLAIHFDLADKNNKVDVLEASSNTASDEKSASAPERIGLTRQTISPMRFFQEVSRMQVGDVIWCGHRICSGDKSFDVSDEPVHSSKCDQETSEQAVVEEPINVAPVAPPIPQSYEVAFQETEDVDSEVAAVVRQANMQQEVVTLPVATLLELMVSKRELAVRLETMQQIMDEREAVQQKIQVLADRNAKLAAMVAVAEARLQQSDALTASVKSTHAYNTGYTATEPTAVQTIQEDLSNIRRQIALLRRTQPVPFATSAVGTSAYRPYQPVFNDDQPSTTTSVGGHCSCVECESKREVAEAKHDKELRPLIGR